MTPYKNCYPSYYLLSIRLSRNYPFKVNHSRNSFDQLEYHEISLAFGVYNYYQGDNFYYHIIALSHYNLLSMKVSLH